MVTRANLVDPLLVAAKWNVREQSAVKSGLHFDDIRGFNVIVPAMPLQERRAGGVARHERLRSVQRESLRQADPLLQTLRHQAFTEEFWATAKTAPSEDSG